MSRGKVWAYAGLGVLVLLNAVLIVLLMRPSAPAPASAATPSPTASTAAAEVPSPTEEAPPSPAPVALQPEPTQRLLWAVSDREAWRAVVGACDVPGLLEHTTDSGVTWTAQPADVNPIGRLKATSVSDVFVIGGGADCAPSFRFSNDAGQTWVTADAELPGSWYLVPASRAALAAEVHGPRGSVPAPCPTGVVDLAGLDTNRAALLCTDGALHTTGDGGLTWVQVGTVAAGVAISPAADGYVVGAVRPTCDGVGLLRVANDGAGSEGDPVACAPTPAPVAGQVAVAASGDVIWVWAGESLAISRDGGATW